MPPRFPRRPPLSPPPPPLIAVPLFLTQVEALADAAGGSDPRTWSGYRRASLARGLARLRAALAGVELHEGEGDIERLGAVIASVRSPAFAALALERARALLGVALVWAACEELPHGETKTRLLDPEAVDGTEWMGDALDALAAAGLRVTLPGEGDEDPDADDGDTQSSV